ncbi:MAG: folate-binding protein [Polaromonas sp.]|nr:folate-binding protein [Polaromonas sp.]
MTASSPNAHDHDATGHFEGLARLPHWGVIRALGDDAVSFLQGQLTQDVAQLGLNTGRLAAFCNPKGRMQASFILVKRSPQEVLLVCSRDILPATLKRLSMFVLRAKARLSDASGDFQLAGVVGDAIENIATNARISLSKPEFDSSNLIPLPAAAGQSRALWCGPADSALPDLPALPPGLWEWLEVQSGVAMITQPVFEAFVPQMLNYESVGGVNFRKGCYPGQEIVARSQFRGTIKRRAYLAHTEGQPVVGQEVFSANDATQPCGLVAAAAASPSGGFDAIVAMQTSAAADGAGVLTLGSPDGPPLRLQPLPYPLLEDI